jgi:hypothetical protein
MDDQALFIGSSRESYRTSRGGRQQGICPAVSWAGPSSLLKLRGAGVQSANRAGCASSGARLLFGNSARRWLGDFTKLLPKVLWVVLQILRLRAHPPQT